MTKLIFLGKSAKVPNFFLVASPEIILFLRPCFYKKILLKITVYKRTTTKCNLFNTFLGDYLGKFTPTNGSGKVIAAETFFLITFFQSIASIIAGGCDGTGTNIY